MKSEGYKFRHELKFMISEAEKDILIKRLHFLCRRMHMQKAMRQGRISS